MDKYIAMAREAIITKPDATTEASLGGARVRDRPLYRKPEVSQGAHRVCFPIHRSLDHVEFWRFERGARPLTRVVVIPHCDVAFAIWSDKLSAAEFAEQAGLPRRQDHLIPCASECRPDESFHHYTLIAPDDEMLDPRAKIEWAISSIEPKHRAFSALVKAGLANWGLSITMAVYPEHNLLRPLDFTLVPELTRRLADWGLPFTVDLQVRSEEPPKPESPST